MCKTLLRAREAERRGRLLLGIWWLEKLELVAALAKALLCCPACSWLGELTWAALGCLDELLYSSRAVLNHL